MIRLLSGDCRDVLPTLPAESVQCVVCSPPYYGLRDYGTALWDGGDAACDHLVTPPKRGNASYTNGQGAAYASNLQAWGDRAVPPPYRDTCGKCGAVRVDRQIGLEATPEAYLATMVQVFREVRRVLRRDGVCFINMGDSYAGSQRATAYDKAGKAPASSTGDGCLCGSLCDGCRKAYRIGRFHSGGQRDPTLVASIASSIPAHTVSMRGHAPTLGFPLPPDHNSGAIPDLAPALHHVGEQPHDALASTTIGCDGQPLASCLQTSTQAVGCLSCGRSLADCAPMSAGMAACTCGTEDGAWVRHTTGTASSGLAYPGYTTASPKPKDLLLMPARLALALQADGWWVRSDIIWHKPNPMPESVTDRPTSAHEHVFLLTRSSRYYYDADAVREANSNPELSECAKDWRERPGNGEWPSGIGGRMGSVQRGRNLRNVWTIATSPYPNAHFATYPAELAERCIKAGTSERGCCASCGKPWQRITDTSYTDAGNGNSNRVRKGGGEYDPAVSARYEVRKLKDVETTGWSAGCRCGTTETRPCMVLDPFIGAGTTALVADRLQRDCIGIDLNTQYTRMAMERCRADAPLFTAFPPAEDPEETRMADLFAEAAE